jgi:hypothetical protein
VPFIYAFLRKIDLFASNLMRDRYLGTATRYLKQIVDAYVK